MTGRILFYLLFITLIIGCGDNFDEDQGSSQLRSGAQNIHWGTSHNTLRGVTITWRSSQPDDSIQWGYSEAYESGEFSGKRRDEYDVYLYDFTFPPLNPLSQIHYTIKSADFWSDDMIFNTAVDTSSENFTFIVGSDCHGGDDDHDSNSRWQLMSELVLNEESEFCIFTGDVVDDDNDWALWKQYYDLGDELVKNKIIFYTWGNHEYGPMALYNSVLPGNEKWYSFEQGNALFISLLSEEDFEMQHEWLLEKLGNTDKDWIIVYFHRPFFIPGSHSDEMDDYRPTWWKAFDDYGVDIVFGGHRHCYIRSVPLNLNVSETLAVEEYGSKPGQGRLELVAGGLGGKNSQESSDWYSANSYSGLHYIKVQISGAKLHFDTFSHLGEVIDSLTIDANGSAYHK